MRTRLFLLWVFSTGLGYVYFVGLRDLMGKGQFSFWTCGAAYAATWFAVAYNLFRRWEGAP